MWREDKEEQRLYDLTPTDDFDIGEFDPTVDEWSVKHVARRGYAVVAKAKSVYCDSLDRTARRALSEAEGLLEGYQDGTLSVGNERLAIALCEAIDHWPENVEPRKLLQLLEDATSVGLTTPGQSLTIEMKRSHTDGLSR